MLNAQLPDSNALPSLATRAGATVAAALTGYGALKLLLRFVHQGKLHVFAPYCFVVGLIALAI